jgi:hypothetical protein
VVRHYYHVHAQEAQRRMNGLNLLGTADGRSVGAIVSSFSSDEVAPGRQAPMTTT